MGNPLNPDPKPPKEPKAKEDVPPPSALGMTAIKPEGWDKTGMEAFKDALYNPKTGEILTRTPLSWIKIITFYIIYYSFLTGFWIACLFIFFQTLPYEKEGPRWQQDYSLIGMNPGIGIRPRSADHRIDSHMIELWATDSNRNPSGRNGEGDSNADYAVRLNQYLELYKNTTLGSGYKPFDRSLLGECENFPYGYVAEEGKPVAPCVFLKLNTIWGWKPERTTCNQPNLEPKEKVDKDCPTTLMKHLESEEAKQAGEENVWIDCNGRYAADREALAEGGLKYYPPSRAIPIDSFPYMGKTEEYSYHSHIVALKVEPRTPGQMVHIECRAYFKDAEHDTRDKKGLIQFELMIKQQF